MRLFFALWPNDDLRAALHNLAREAQIECGGRVMRAETLHLTLIFLGEVNPAALPALREIQRNTPLPPCSLSLDLLGYWPSNRIVWSGARTVPEELRATRSRLLHQLRAHGHRVSGAGFHPHVTLLRHARRAPTELVRRTFVWPCSDYVLVHSIITPRGPIYRLLPDTLPVTPVTS